MGLVLDASVTLSWIMPGQSTQEGDAVLEAIMQGHSLVPALWRYEVAAVLSRGVLTHLLTEALVREFLGELDTLDIRTRASHVSLFELVELAQETKLSVYDAAYLHLSEGERLPLATLDLDLAKAARARGVRVLGGL